jgi:hypothetical protein
MRDFETAISQQSKKLSVRGMGRRVKIFKRGISSVGIAASGKRTKGSTMT